MREIRDLMALTGLALVAGLSACAHVAEPVATCLPLRAYTPQQQQQLATALGGLPGGSIILDAMVDYSAMRDADRACLATHKP